MDLKFAKIHLKIKAQKVDPFEESTEKVNQESFPGRVKLVENFIAENDLREDPKKYLQEELKRRNADFDQLSWTQKHSILTQILDSLKQELKIRNRVNKSLNKPKKSLDAPKGENLWTELTGKGDRGKGTHLEGYDEVVGFVAEVHNLDSAISWAKKNQRSGSAIINFLETMSRAETGNLNTGPGFRYTPERFERYISFLEKAGERWDPKSLYFTKLKARLESELPGAIARLRKERIAKLDLKFKKLIRFAKFVTFAHNYQIQIFDDEVMDESESNFGVMNFRIRVQGQPLDPNQIIPAILPQIQSYIENNYPAYEIDNITFDNFNPGQAEVSQRFPNTIDFYFSANFSPKGA